jgi:glycosyltransferase involved in cell wall biosynthesis
VLDPDLLAGELAGPLGAGDVVVLLGPESELGAAVTRRRDDLAHAALAPWRELVPTTHLVVELVSHRLAGGAADGWGPGTTPHAARMAGVARQAGLGTVLTNAVRYAERHDAPTVDVLDAARRLVALGSADLRRVGPGGVRGNAEGFLKSGKQMQEVAEEIYRSAGLGSDPEREARRLLARSRLLAQTSVMEGGANTVSETLASGVPVVASDVPGNVGMLGEDYPGYYKVGDEEALARLLHRAETDTAFYGELKARCDARRYLVLSEREKAALGSLVEEVRSRAVV